jgi:hypothetical protein
MDVIFSARRTPHSGPSHRYLHHCRLPDKSGGVDIILAHLLYVYRRQRSITLQCTQIRAHSNPLVRPSSARMTPLRPPGSSNITTFNQKLQGAMHSRPPT